MRRNPIVLALMISSLAVAGCIPRPIPKDRLPPPESAAVAKPDAQASASAWRAQEVTRNAEYIPASEYQVERGDTLSAIGQRTGVGMQALAQANGLAAPYKLYPGQRLAVPGGVYHSVSAGETGIAIARAYGVRWSDIVALNRLREPFILHIGQGLRLPAEALPLSPEEQVARHASAFTLNIDDIITGSNPAQARDTASSDSPAGATTSTTSTAGSTASASSTPSTAQATNAPAPSRFSGRFQWPLEGRIIAGFGRLAHGKVSDGINIAARPSAEVRAAADGTVVYAGKEISVYGGLILINHGGGWISAYGHAAALQVERGQVVKAGDTIAIAGSSGQVQSPQLHFQIRKDRIPVNPIDYLPAR